MTKEENTLYGTNDRKISIVLMMEGLTLIKKTREKGKFIFYFDLDAAYPVVSKWQSNDPYFATHRTLFQKEELFNSIIHEDI
jgi:hypothetical protein